MVKNGQQFWERILIDYVNTNTNCNAAFIGNSGTVDKDLNWWILEAVIKPSLQEPQKPVLLGIDMILRKLFDI